MVGAESRLGRVNAGMPDQAQTYESAGESAKELALHLCGKTTLGVFGAHGVPRPTIRVRKVARGSPLPAAISKYNG